MPVPKNILELITVQPITIPIFHEVCFRIQTMVKDDDYRIEDVIKLISDDPSLSSEMLKQANTVYSRGREPITTIKNAIVRLGSKQILNLAFGASLASHKFTNEHLAKTMTDLWQHSHTVALATSWLLLAIKSNKKLPDEIKNAVKNVDIDEGYLAGLLHDVGKFHLLKAMERLADAAIIEISEPLIAAVFDKLQPQQGIKLMEHWSIPRKYIRITAGNYSNNWKIIDDNYTMAAVRISDRIDKFVASGIHLTEDSPEYSGISDECEILAIEDIAHFSNLVQSLR